MHLVYPIVEKLDIRIGFRPSKSACNNLFAKVSMNIRNGGLAACVDLYINPAELNFVANLSEKT